MAIKQRKNIYKRVKVDGNKELDYLQSAIYNLKDLDYVTYRIPSHMARRPDLLSYHHYGDSDYGWLILEFNDILDVWDELAPGEVIKLPSLKQYYNFFNKNKTRD